jgi:hypothetical protein
VAVARERHFARAAAACHLSQSSHAVPSIAAESYKGLKSLDSWQITKGKPLDCKSGGVWFAEAQMKSTAVQCTFTVYFLSILDPPLETAAALLLFASLAIPADGCGR